MFLEKDDLKNNIYDYNLSQITNDNDDIVNRALAIAEQELKGYLTPNNKREWNDGRIVFDVDVIFAKTGSDRNELLVGYGCTIAKWYIVDLCNSDMIYEQAKERYDRVKKDLRELRDGEFTPPDLEIKEPPADEELEDGQEQFIYGSRAKFNHE